MLLTGPRWGARSASTDCISGEEERGKGEGKKGKGKREGIKGEGEKGRERRKWKRGEKGKEERGEERRERQGYGGKNPKLNMATALVKGTHQ